MLEENNKKLIFLVIGISVTAATLTTIMVFVILSAVIPGSIVNTVGLGETLNLVRGEVTFEVEDGRVIDKEEGIKQRIEEYEAEIQSLYDANPGDWEIGQDGEPIVPVGIQVDIDAVKAERDAFMKANGL